MSVSFSSRISVPDGVLLRELDEESLFLNLESECYFGLDDVGTRMWAALTEASSIQEAYEALLAEYDVPPEILERDLTALIEKLSQHGLVELRDA